MSAYFESGALSLTTQPALNLTTASKEEKIKQHETRWLFLVPGKFGGECKEKKIERKSRRKEKN